MRNDLPTVFFVKFTKDNFEEGCKLLRQMGIKCREDFEKDISKLLPKLHDYYAIVKYSNALFTPVFWVVDVYIANEDIIELDFEDFSLLARIESSKEFMPERVAFCQGI